MTVHNVILPMLTVPSIKTSTVWHCCKRPFFSIPEATANIFFPIGGIWDFAFYAIFDEGMVVEDKTGSRKRARDRDET